MGLIRILWGGVYPTLFMSPSRHPALLIPLLPGNLPLTLFRKRLHANALFDVRRRLEYYPFTSDDLEVVARIHCLDAVRQVN